MIEYRDATEKDTKELYLLFKRFFSLEPHFMSSFDPFIGKVATDNGKIVGAVKLLSPDISYFEDWEVQYTAVYEAYQRQGIAEQLILQATKDIHGKIYGSAWRTWDNPTYAHIHSVCTKIGFKLVERGYKHWDAKHFCKSADCLYVDNKDKPMCECWEDVYLWEKE